MATGTGTHAAPDRALQGGGRLLTARLKLFMTTMLHTSRGPAMGLQTGEGGREGWGGAGAGAGGRCSELPLAQPADGGYPDSWRLFAGAGRLARLSGSRQRARLCLAGGAAALASTAVSPHRRAALPQRRPTHRLQGGQVVEHRHEQPADVDGGVVNVAAALGAGSRAAAGGAWARPAEKELGGCSAAVAGCEQGCGPLPRAAHLDTEPSRRRMSGRTYR